MTDNARTERFRAAAYDEALDRTYSRDEDIDRRCRNAFIEGTEWALASVTPDAPTPSTLCPARSAVSVCTRMAEHDGEHVWAPNTEHGPLNRLKADQRADLRAFAAARIQAVWDDVGATTAEVLAENIVAAQEFAIMQWSPPIMAAPPAPKGGNGEPVRWLVEGPGEKAFVADSDVAALYRPDNGWTVTPLYRRPTLASVTPAAPEHGPDWSDWQEGDDGDSCRCGFNGSSGECVKSRRADLLNEIDAGGWGEDRGQMIDMIQRAGEILASPSAAPTPEEQLLRDIFANDHEHAPAPDHSELVAELRDRAQTDSPAHDLMRRAADALAGVTHPDKENER